MVTVAKPMDSPEQQSNRKSMALSCMALSNLTLPETIYTHGRPGVVGPHTLSLVPTNIFYTVYKGLIQVFFQGWDKEIKTETPKSLTGCVSSLFVFSAVPTIIFTEETSKNSF